MLNPQIALVVALPRNVPALKITAKPCLRLDICEGSKRSQTAIDWPNLTRRDHHPYSKADYVALQLNRCRTVPALEALKIRLSFCRGCELRFDSTTAEWVKPKRHRGVFVAPNQRRCDHVQRLGRSPIELRFTWASTRRCMNRRSLPRFLTTWSAKALLRKRSCAVSISLPNGCILQRHKFR